MLGCIQNKTGWRVVKVAGRVVHGLNASCCVACGRHPGGEGLLA